MEKDSEEKKKAVGNVMMMKTALLLPMLLILYCVQKEDYQTLMMFLLHVKYVMLRISVT